MKRYDVVIVGAGPAGLNAATILAKNNKNVLVLEKNKVIGPKVCAAGITHKDLKFIDKRLIEISFNSFHINYKNKVLTINSKQPFVYTISRKSLGQWQLRKAKKAGAEIRTNALVKEIKDNSLTVNNKKIGFNYLIGADGSNSIVRRHLGLRTDKLIITLQYTLRKNFSKIEAFYNRSKFGIGFAWIFPHKGYTKIGCGSRIKSMSISKLKNNFHQWLKEKNINFSNAKLESTIINCDYKGYKFGNIFLAGDAAGLASELTGEGIYQAMVSSQEIARKIINPKYKCEEMQKIVKSKEGNKGLLKIVSYNKLIKRLVYLIISILMKNNLFHKGLIKKFSYN